MLSLSIRKRYSFDSPTQSPSLLWRCTTAALATTSFGTVASEVTESLTFTVSVRPGPTVNPGNPSSNAPTFSSWSLFSNVTGCVRSPS